MILTHSARDKDWVYDPKRTYPIEGERGLYKRPSFWLSVDHGWKEWCLSEFFGWEGYNSHHEFVIKSSSPSLIQINTLEQLDLFHNKYSIDPGYKYKSSIIDWVQLEKEGWAGVLISPYFYARRFTYSWYSTWDCASASIWNLDCLEYIGQYKGYNQTKDLLTF